MQIKAAQDVIELVKLVEDLMYNYESQKDLAHSLVDAMCSFYRLFQGRHMTNEKLMIPPEYGLSRLRQSHTILPFSLADTEPSCNRSREHMLIRC